MCFHDHFMEIRVGNGNLGQISTQNKQKGNYT